MYAILGALRPGPFMDKLTRKKPTNMEELKKIAAGYIDTEEIAASKISQLGSRSDSEYI